MLRFSAKAMRMFQGCTPQSSWYNPGIMSPETTSSRLCPTCGTRLAENATRCVVCGSEFSAPPKKKAKSEKAVQGSRMPEITLSLPVAIAILAVFLIIGAGALYFTLKGTNQIQPPTVTPTPTETPTLTLTPTETLVPTETPTPTLEPPIEYKVQAGDSCGAIAGLYNSSVAAIISLNGLNSTCTNLAVGSTIKVPRPTPTPLPPATATLEPAAATRAACEKVVYTVQANDSLSGIAANYGVSMQAIKDFNGLSTDSVMIDQPITIPLCMRAATPGPSPTPTTPPPYPAPNLLLPADGDPFTISNETVPLQWASVGTLRENESYEVSVEDATAEVGRTSVAYVTDTKYIVPTSFRPQDNQAHIIYWSVTTVRQTGTDEDGNPVWSTAGAASPKRGFTWMGSGTAPTPTK
jgi:LysM repeat protein